MIILSSIPAFRTLRISVAFWLLGCSPLRAQESDDTSGGATLGQPETRSYIADEDNHEGTNDYQITISGGTPQARAMIISFSNELRDDFRQLLYQVRADGSGREPRNYWKIPIRIELWGDVSDVFRDDPIRIQTQILPDNRLVVILAVRLHDQFTEKPLQRGLIEAMLRDQILSPFADAPLDLADRIIVVPEWMIQGFDQLIEHRRSGHPSEDYRSFLAGGKLLDPQEILSVTSSKELDPINLQIFRASASALVDALLDQENGDVSFRNMLGDLASGSDRVEASMRQHFPGFRETDQGLEKWWALQLATMSTQQALEFLPPDETVAQIQRALTIRLEAEAPTGADSGKAKEGWFGNIFPKKPASSHAAFSGNLADYESFLDHPQSKKALARSFNDIQRLKRTGFPLFRPVLSEYEIIIVQLSREETKGIDEALIRAATMQTRISETLTKARDVMNHYEASRMPERSDAFEDYRKVREAWDRRGQPRRQDRISEVLDAVEAGQEH
jgi:hypothetical protein